MKNLCFKLMLIFALLLGKEQVSAQSLDWQPYSYNIPIMVTVMVSDKDGRSVSGAEVHATFILSDLGWVMEVMGMTDWDGMVTLDTEATYELGLYPNGVLEIHVTAPGYREFWYAGRLTVGLLT